MLFSVNCTCQQCTKTKTDTENKDRLCVCMWTGGVWCVYLGLPLEDDHSASFVPCGQELASVVELNSGDYIS